MSKEPGGDPTTGSRMVEAARTKKLDPALKKQIEPQEEKEKKS